MGPLKAAGLLGSRFLTWKGTKDQRDSKLASFISRAATGGIRATVILYELSCPQVELLRGFKYHPRRPCCVLSLSLSLFLWLGWGYGVERIALNPVTARIQNRQAASTCCTGLARGLVDVSLAFQGRLDTQPAQALQKQAGVIPLAGFL